MQGREEDRARWGMHGVAGHGTARRSLTVDLGPSLEIEIIRDDDAIYFEILEELHGHDRLSGYND